MKSQKDCGGNEIDFGPLDFALLALCWLIMLAQLFRAFGFLESTENGGWAHRFELLLIRFYVSCEDLPSRMCELFWRLAIEELLGKLVTR